MNQEQKGPTSQGDISKVNNMASEAQLHAMGLSLNEEGDGVLLASSNWAAKLSLHALIKKSTLTEDKPIGDISSQQPIPQQTPI